MSNEQVKMEGFSNVWDNSVPVEKSSYLHDHFVQYLNVENFKHDSDKLAMIDLFCGAGGFAVGASWAGFESVIGIDHLEPAMETWMYNHPNAIGCLGDIKQVDPEYLKKQRAALVRKHRQVIYLNDSELAAINLYCEKFRVGAKAALYRKAIMEKVLTELEDNHPTLF